jgi:hypothetical protein
MLNGNDDDGSAFQWISVFFCEQIYCIKVLSSEEEEEEGEGEGEDSLRAWMAKHNL